MRSRAGPASACSSRAPSTSARGGSAGATWRRPPGSAPRELRAVLLGDRDGRGDVREVRQALREVAEHLLRVRVVLLGEEHELVRGRDGAVEHRARLVEPALARQALGEPERTGEEGAFRLTPSAPDAIAQDEP